jgi:hypothetical protein
VRIFISYRRTDTGGFVPTLDRILRESGVGGDACETFLDIDTIAPGRNFVDAMTQAIASSDVVLAVVGRRWLLPDGTRRLDAPDDPVRLELRTAIASGTPLIAVRMAGGTLPAASELPPDLRDLTRAPAVDFSGSDDTFERDAAVLLAKIAGVGRRSGRAAAPATLRFVNEAAGWVTSGDRYSVEVDGRTVTMLLSGKGPTDVPLPGGKHTVRLRRGLRASEPVTVMLRPDQVTVVAYEVGFWSISLRPKA